MTEEISVRTKLNVLWSVATYRPATTATIICLSLLTTLLEGVGLSFLLPVIEYARTGGNVEDSGSTLLRVFVEGYQYLGVPFTLEYIVFGVALVMTIRVATGFLVAWISQRLQTNYIRSLQTDLFDAMLGGRLEYLEQRGSDALLNELLTRVYYAESVFGGFVGLVQQLLLVIMYFAVAFYLSPLLTVLSVVLFTALALTVRGTTESAEILGERVATAHEEVQSISQVGTQGIRELKLFGMTDTFSERFHAGVERYARSTISLDRNQAAMESSYHLAAMLLVFVMLYIAITRSALAFAELGIYLFVVYRLAPQINGLNGLIYQLEGSLPHTVRTQQFLADLAENQHTETPTATVPATIDRIEFRDVSFAYEVEPVVKNVTFAVERGEFVAFVGPSGAGKSTLAALLARLYEPMEGEIIANGTPIDQFSLSEWRSRVAVVPQDPYILDETLRDNITFGAGAVSEAAFERACEAAQVTEFCDDLDEGYETTLGDNAVRLSGGQRRRVAIARALVRDAEILLLDEATSDLDTELEQQVHTAIDAFDPDLTVVVITHRLGSITDADRLYTVEDGHITEAGTHKELLQNDGTYSTLYTAQSHAP